MQVEVVGTIPNSHRRTLWGWGRDIFGAGVEKRLKAYGCRAFSIMLLGFEGDEPVTALGMVQASVLLNGEPMSVSGFGGLVVVPGMQGRGYGARLIEKAKALYPGPGLLAFCEPHRLSYYKRRGFSEVPCPVIVQTRSGEPMPTPQHTIWGPGEMPPITSLDVQGPRW